MITNINEFADKFEKGQIKIVEGIFIENFDEMEMEMDDMDMEMDEEDLNTEMTDIDVVEEKPVVTLDTLKDTLLNKFNSDEDGQESIMLSDEQLQVVYDTLIELGVVSTEEVKPEGEEFETEETEEGVEEEEFEEFEEGFGKFLKDKINKTVAEDDESVQQRRTALINRIAKLAGKDVYVQIAKQPETLTSLKDNSVEDVVDKIGTPDTFNGNFLKPIVDKSGKTVISYTPGASGFLSKAGAAVSGLTTGK